jgi:hypothetical protein
LEPIGGAWTIKKNPKPFNIIQAADSGIFVSDRYKISGEYFLTLAHKFRIVEAQASTISGYEFHCWGGRPAWSTPFALVCSSSVGLEIRPEF